MAGALAFDEKHYPDVHTLVAFSGTVSDGRVDYTEPQMIRGIAESALTR